MEIFSFSLNTLSDSTSILSGKSRLCYLLFHAKHVALSHCGPSLLLSSTGNRVHILGARCLSKAMCRSCVVCRWSTAQMEKQMMGQLPVSRVNPSPPFTICGVDYAGPFLLKRGYTRKPQVVKAYLCVFVCFSTKATHLEVVADATTESFLSSLRRFVSRRGRPAHIHSDNGGNFRWSQKRPSRALQALGTGTYSISHHHIPSGRMRPLARNAGKGTPLRWIVGGSC